VRGLKASCRELNSASELRAIDKRLERIQGGAINKAIITQRYRESLTDCQLSEV
jgi:hypothetical protein